MISDSIIYLNAKIVLKFTSLCIDNFIFYFKIASDLIFLDFQIFYISI